MALTYEELIRLRGPGGTTGMDTTGINANTGVQRTGRRGTATQLAADTRQFVGGVAPRARTAGNGTALPGRAGALTTGVQAGRQVAETGANDQIAENLRLNLIEQQRLAGNARAPGTVNPVQFRAMQAERAGNQSAVNSGVDAINELRRASVAERGLNVDASAAMLDREMQGADGFDQALLGLDATNLRGQFGLGQEFLRQTMTGNNALALNQSVDPLTAARLRLGGAFEQGVEGLPPEQQAPMLAAVMDAYAGAPLAPAFAPATQEVQLADGSTISLSDTRALSLAAQQDPRLRLQLEAEGAIFDERGALVRITGGRPSPARVTRQTTPSGLSPLSPMPTDGLSPLRPMPTDGLSPLSPLPTGGIGVTPEDVISNGFPNGDAATQPQRVQRWAMRNRQVIANMTPQQQLALRAQLGESVDPYLTIDADGAG